MMKKLMCFLFVAGSFSTAFARDSTWKICSGSTELFGENLKLAINVFEHRSGASHRATDLALIFGNNILRGSFDSTDLDSATVTLKEKKSTYKGLVAVDYQKDTLTLNGILDLQEKTAVNAVFKCETFGD